MGFLPYLSCCRSCMVLYLTPVLEPDDFFDVCKLFVLLDGFVVGLACIDDFAFERKDAVTLSADNT